MFKVDSRVQLPSRRWLAVHKMSLLEYKCTNILQWCKISMVTKCGWLLTADLTLEGDKTNLSINISHHTPRIQMFNSANQRVNGGGGIALQFSLPELSIPSINKGNLIWMG